MRRLAFGLAAALFVLTACDGSADSEHDVQRVAPAQPPSVTWGECPADIEVTFTGRHDCGVLTVPVDRADPSKGTLDLTVARA